jgi:major membrane immunogen (membrane-anchored lipoprotein)
MLKKLLAVALIFSLAACGGATDTDTDTSDQGSTDNGSTEAMYEDGFYFAQAEFAGNGWGYFVAFEIKDDKFTNVEWNGVHRDGGATKAERAEAGEYVLASADGGAMNWAEQAAELVKFFEEEQSVEAINLTDEDGHTDAVSGVTVKVGEFPALVEEALANGPVEKGSYEDGAYYAEAAEFGNGYKYNVGMTVKYGMILSAGWNALNEDPEGMTKREASMEGEYVLANDGGLQWHEQAALVEEAFLASQDISSITLTDEDGHTDAVSGATIKVGDYVALVEEALANGPQ